VANRIAIKQLTASDCSLFKDYFTKHNKHKQKGINLNADILTGQFYPDLAAIASLTNNQVPLPISIFGPEGEGAQNCTRKIVKSSSSKNWRLNGELIVSPDNEVARYDNVQPEDLAVMAFDGDAAPQRMDLILVSKTGIVDGALHTALAALFGNNTMIGVTASQIAAAANNAGVPETHPIYVAAADPEAQAALEDAALGGFEGANKLLKNRGGKKVSSADLAKAKAKAEQTGQEGEGLVNAHLAAQLAAGRLESYSWVSTENAVAPYDFDTLASGNERTLIDAKSTSGPFNNAIHLSLAEIIEAAGDVPYRVYRVFEIDENGGKLRISEDIRPLAKKLKELHEAHIPSEVRVDSFSVSPDALKWSEELNVELPDEELYVELPED
jgi:hypothetical protein